MDHKDEVHRKLTKSTFVKNTMANLITDVIKHPSRMMSVEEDEVDEPEAKVEVEVVEEETGKRLLSIPSPTKRTQTPPRTTRCNHVYLKLTNPTITSP